jgi:hypothetical protein
MASGIGLIGLIGIGLHEALTAINLAVETPEATAANAAVEIEEAPTAPNGAVELRKDAVETKRDIRKIIAENPGKSNCALGRELGVSETTIRRIRNPKPRGPRKKPQRDITQLPAMGCKWPTGERNGSWTFCGAKKLIVENKLYPYCENHVKMAYQKSSGRPAQPHPWRPRPQKRVAGKR